MLCEVGEYLSVERHAFRFERVYEPAVREAEWSDRCAYLYLPESAEVVLFVAAVSESVGARVKDRFARLALLCAPSKTIPFRLFENTSSPF